MVSSVYPPSICVCNKCVDTSQPSSSPLPDDTGYYLDVNLGFRIFAYSSNILRDLEVGLVVLEVLLVQRSCSGYEASLVHYPSVGTEGSL
jgi:hypothetical protein